MIRCAAGVVGLGVGLALAAAACETPTPSLQLAFAGGPSQKCPDTDCANIAMSCATVMSIRIIDPADPTAPYHSQCVYVPADLHHDMCSLARVDLGKTPIPVRDLEVQVALYPKSVIPIDPITDDLLCPTDVAYGATGFPLEEAPSPALGGHAFYHPGDETVEVTLGCTNLDAINKSCASDSQVTVTATVDEFDSRFPVNASSPTADGLRVSVGEPRAQGGSFVLNPSDVHDLAAADVGAGGGGIATWVANIANLALNKFVCVEVLDENSLTPPVLRCRPASMTTPLNLTGVWISRQTVAKVLQSISTDPLPSFPPEGLTIGVVVDQGLSPAAGIVVTSSAASAAGSDHLDTTGTVAYLSNDGGLGGTATSAAGIFVSRDAPFGTQFSVGGPGRPTVVGYGGLVAGKITVVILAAAPVTAE
jgi:hypothetical protein